MVDMLDQLRELASRADALASSARSEEATKNALVMPFIRALGYDVFDPQEVVPEFTADVGVKKGEKVDYAILRNGGPIMLFECKPADATLDEQHRSQLFRYFTTTAAARIGVLTNGTEYRFFSDLEARNRMDDRPFFTFSLEGFSDADAGELKRFTKARFDLESLIEAAQDLKYTRGMAQVLQSLFDQPDDEFVRHMTTRVYSGRLTKAVLDQFAETTRRGFHAFVRDQLNAKFASLMEGGTSTATDAAAAEPADGTAAPEPSTTTAPASPDDLIETTADEIAGYYAVKSMLHGVVDVKRVTMRDVRSYCGILMDDNNRKPICRLHFNGRQKFVGIFDAEKHEERIALEMIDDLYSHAERIRSTAAQYA